MSAAASVLYDQAAELREERLRIEGLALRELELTEQADAAQVDESAQYKAAMAEYTEAMHAYRPAQDLMIAAARVLLADFNTALTARARVEASFRTTQRLGISGCVLPPRIAARETAGERDLRTLREQLRAMALGDV